MRLSIRHIAAATALVGFALAGCQSSDLPIPRNGPSNQWFSTNNVLLRIVDGSPVAGPVGCTPAVNCSVDVAVDGTAIFSGLPFGGILPYASFPSGQALIQIYQHGTFNLVFEGSVAVSAGKKYSFVLGGQTLATPPAPPFYNGYLTSDGLFNAGLGGGMVDFHNASPNASALQFSFTCTACPAGGQLVGGPTGPGAIAGPANVIPSSGYSLNATNGTAKSILPSAINPADTGNSLPDPAGKPNVSVYAVDTPGLGSSHYTLIGTEDSNG
jgi:hypothetical protein